MTAFSIKLEPRRLSVASDTISYDVGEQIKPVGFVTKIHALPMLPAVVFHCGQNWIIARAVMDTMCDPQLGDLETAVERIATYFAEAAKWYCEHAELAGDHSDYGLSRAIVAGWCTRQNRMRLWSMQNMDHFEPIESSGPGYKTLPALPPEYINFNIDKLSTEKALVALMCAQKLYHSSLDDARALIGGHIRMWSVDPDRIAERCIYKFADHEEMATAGAAVTAAKERSGIYPNVADGLQRVADYPTAAATTTETVEADISQLSRPQRRRIQQAARRAGRAA